MAYNIQDYKEENSNSKTLILTNIDENIKYSDIADTFGSFGQILNIELPIQIKNDKLKNYFDLKIEQETINNVEQIYKLSDDYMNEFENSNADLSSEEKLKRIKDLGKNFKIAEQLVKSFKMNCLDREISDMKNNELLVKLRFFLNEIFPKKIVNSLINDVILNTPKREIPNPISDIVQLSQENMAKAYEKIASNLNKLIQSHKEKVEKMTAPLEPDQIPINLFNNNKHNTSESN